MKNYKSVGYLTHKLIASNDDCDYYDFEFNDCSHFVDVSYSDMFTGIDFLESVKNLSLTDYDGWVTDLFINGYESKIRLGYCGNIDGDYKEEYLVFEEEAFLELCNEYKVEVFWINK